MGHEVVTRFIRGLVRKQTSFSARPIDVNGATAIAILDGETLDSIVTFAIAEHLIVAIHMIRNPDKLAHLTQGAV